MIDEKKLDSKETLDEVTTLIKNDVESRTKMNRAQRRKLQHKMGKAGRNQFNTIAETTKKLNYIDLIQKLRELNKKKENEENGSIDSSED